MVKVDRHQAVVNREALIAAAGKLLRSKGIDGVGVAELCAAAGLTAGALYSRFGSKNELVAEVFLRGQAASQARLRGAMHGRFDLPALIRSYVSERQRDNMEECCPMLASASDAARQDEPFRRNFAAAFAELTDLIGAASGRPGNADRRTSMVIAASMIGVVAVARALNGPDPDRSAILLNSGRQLLADLAATPRVQSSKRRRKGVTA